MKQHLPWILRILVAALFVFSAFTKMVPLWAFEKQLVDLGIASWCSAHYLARGIVALELAIGLALLFNHYIRSLVVPGTILLLVLFNVHLAIEMVKHGPMNGNCGCFGQIIEMTPLEAFIKNLVTIGILIYIFTKVKDHEKDRNRIIYPISLFLASLVFMFIAFPFAPCKKEVKTTYTNTIDSIQSDAATVLNNTTRIEDTLQQVATAPSKDTNKISISAPLKKDTLKKANATNAATTKTTVETKPKRTPVRSKFAEFTQFGNKTTNLDKGNKIVCMFAPGCDHCQATAKKLGEMSRTIKGFPEVYILFMDEETDKIPDFYKISNSNFPSVVLDISKFWQVMGTNASTPAVFYLEEGNIVKYYQGIDNEEFKADELKGIMGF